MPAHGMPKKEQRHTAIKEASLPRRNLERFQVIAEITAMGNMRVFRR